MEPHEMLMQDLIQPFPENLVETVGPREDRYVAWTHWAQRALLQVGFYHWVISEMLPPQMSRRPIYDEDDKFVEMREQWSEWVCIGGISFDAGRSAASLNELPGKQVTVTGVGQGRDAKAAESDAFKRAWSKTGMGQHLWAEPAYWLEAGFKKKHGLTDA